MYYFEITDFLIVSPKASWVPACKTWQYITVILFYNAWWTLQSISISFLIHNQIIQILLSVWLLETTLKISQLCLSAPLFLEICPRICLAFQMRATVKLNLGEVRTMCYILTHRRLIYYNVEQLIWVSVSGNTKPHSGLELVFVPVLALIWINPVLDEHYWFQ